jgi:hypothetical protein
MEIYEGLTGADGLLLPATEGAVYVCLLIIGSIPLIFYLLKRTHKRDETSLLPVYNTETNTNIISNHPNVKLRMNVADTPRPYLNI